MCEIGAGKYVAGQVRVTCVNTAVDEADQHALPLADLLRAADVEEGQMPLRVPGLVRRDGRYGRRRDQQADDTGPGYAQRVPHRSIPKTPGPGSWRGSGPGSRT